jgi:hypothetical protein
MSVLYQRDFISLFKQQRDTGIFTEDIVYLVWEGCPSALRRCLSRASASTIPQRQREQLDGVTDRMDQLQFAVQLGNLLLPCVCCCLASSG